MEAEPALIDMIWAVVHHHAETFLPSIPDLVCLSKNLANSLAIFDTLSRQHAKKVEALLLFVYFSKFRGKEKESQGRGGGVVAGKETD